MCLRDKLQGDGVRGKEKTGDGVRGKAVIHWSTLRIPTMSGIGPGWSWESGTQSLSPTWLEGTESFEPLVLPSLVSNRRKMKSGVRAGCWKPISSDQECWLLFKNVFKISFHFTSKSDLSVLTHHPNAWRSQGWTRMKPGVYGTTWAIIYLLLPRLCISRKLDRKLDQKCV